MLTHEEVGRLRAWIDAAPDVEPLMARLAEMERAVAAAVEFAEYVEQAAKGAMVERARHFLSMPFANEVQAKLALAEAVMGAEVATVQSQTIWPHGLENGARVRLVRMPENDKE